MALALAMLTAAACGSGSSSSANAPSVSTPSPAIGVMATATVNYCVDGGKQLSLDMYEPRDGGAPHPLLIFVHGGSWAFGSSSLGEQSQLVQGVIHGVLGHGFAVASLNYRLAPGDQWPAQIIDVRCAIRYLRATSAHWNVDPHRFAAMGNSAGAQLVSLAALSDGQVPQWNTSEYSGQSGAVAAVVDCWGPIDLTAAGWSKTAVQIGQIVFRISLGTQADTLSVASPVSYVHAGEPPFLIIQGTSDQLVPPTQSSELRDRLVAAGDVATLVDVSNAAHELRPAGGVISPTVNALTTQTVAFLVAAVG